MYQRYEGIFIIKNTGYVDRIKETIDRINNMLLSEKCKIIDKKEMGLRPLAFEVKGYKQGYYYYIQFDVPKNIKNSKISVKINTIEEVIKQIIMELEVDQEKKFVGRQTIKQI